jgi:hypothetical protein
MVVMVVTVMKSASSQLPPMSRHSQR